MISVLLGAFIHRLASGMDGYTLPAVTIGSLALVYILRTLFKKATQFFLIVIIFIFIVTRLLIMKNEYGKASSISFFLLGYAYAIFSAFLLKVFFRLSIEF